MTEAEVFKEAVVYPKTITANRRYQAFRAIVDTDETITLDVGTITAAGHAVFKLSDGSAVTHTVATNQITITEIALTDEDVVGFAVGAVPA